eukprot:scaffold100595_cov33-Tisochrysis_lutea.AAC.2
MEAVPNARTCSSMGQEEAVFLGAFMRRQKGGNSTKEQLRPHNAKAVAQLILFAGSQATCVATGANVHVPRWRHCFPRHHLQRRVWAWLLLIPCALDVSGCLLLLLCLPYECHSSAFEAEAHRALVRLLRACDAGRSVARESHN